MTVPRLDIHPDGPSMPRLIFGVWRLVDTHEAKVNPRFVAERIEAAVDAGLDAIDSADVYGKHEGERVLGAGLAEWGGDRESIQIISKCGIAFAARTRPQYRVKHYNSTREHIVASVDSTLAALGTDYLDVLLIHRPDPLMDADDTADGLETVCQAGKVRHVGVSNFLPHQLSLLQSRLDRPLITNQVEFSILQTEALYDGTLDQCQRGRVSPMIWSPLAGGRLFASKEPRETRIRKVIAQVEHQHEGFSSAQVMLAWVLNHPSKPIPVVGTARVDRIRSYAAACDLQLDRQEWYAILEAAHGAPVP